MPMNGVLSVLPSTADLRTMTRAPRRDLLCGLTVAVVALPSPSVSGSRPVSGRPPD